MEMSLSLIRNALDCSTATRANGEMLKIIMILCTLYHNRLGRVSPMTDCLLYTSPSPRDA
eukprot:5981838-Heterocapsa_arctica.AAC.1